MLPGDFHPTMTTPSPVVSFSRQFTEADDFAAALMGGEFEYLPVPGQPFIATLRTLAVGDVVIQQADDAAHNARAMFAGELAGLIIPLDGTTDAVRMDGAPVNPRHAFFAPGGVEFRAHCARPQRWAAIALPFSVLEAWSSAAAMPVPWRGEANLLTVAQGAGERLSGALAAAARLVEDTPAILSAPSVGVGLAASLRELVADAIAGEASQRISVRATREAVRVVRQVEAYLEANVDRPLYREDLCAVTGVSLRKLHDAFIAIVGVSPNAYLKLRRLALARRALRSQGTDPVLVKSVALAHGFWHLGYFAHDYRSLFGETPSETQLARGHPTGQARRGMPRVRRA